MQELGGQRGEGAYFWENTVISTYGIQLVTSRSQIIMRVSAILSLGNAMLRATMIIMCTPMINTVSARVLMLMSSAKFMYKAL